MTSRSFRDLLEEIFDVLSEIFGSAKSIRQLCLRMVCLLIETLARVLAYQMEPRVISASASNSFFAILHITQLVHGMEAD